LEAGAQIGEIFELEVSLGAVAGGDLFVIHAHEPELGKQAGSVLKPPHANSASSASLASMY
jgi:hypothetical protein